MGIRKKAFAGQAARRRMKAAVWDAAAESETPTPEVLDRGIDFMVHRRRADAIIATNDVWAAQFILRLQQTGRRIPEDVAVIGYDNLDIAQVVSPALTTIDQCHEDYARNALELVLALASGRKIPAAGRLRTITPRLIIRASA